MADSSERLDFLKPEHLHPDGSEITIGDSIRTFKSKYGIQLVILVTVGTKRYDWGLKINSANHQAIEKKFGRNLIKWSGRKIRATRGTWSDNGTEKAFIDIEGAERSDRF